MGSSVAHMPPSTELCEDRCGARLSSICGILLRNKQTNKRENVTFLAEEKAIRVYCSYAAISLAIWTNSWTLDTLYASNTTQS